MNFIHEENRIYARDEKDHMYAVVTFPKAGDHLVNIDHTYVDSAYRGQGIAAKLMEEAVVHLKEHNLKAKASCSYAAKWFQEHPEHSDLLA